MAKGCAEQEGIRNHRAPSGSLTGMGMSYVLLKMSLEHDFGEMCSARCVRVTSYKFGDERTSRRQIN